MTPPLHLTAGDWDLLLLPGSGAGLAYLRCRGTDLLVPVPPGERPGAGPWGAFWMLPWTNRLEHGRLGDIARFPINKPEDDAAIHGLSRDHPWEVLESHPDRAVLVQRLAIGPYAYEARLELALDSALHIALAVTNTGPAPMPFGLGWHPWFPRRPGTHLAFRAAARFRHDARAYPVAAEPSPGFDGGEDALLGLDTHFAGWDGAALLRWPELALRLLAEGAWAANLQVYAPPARPVLCVEPVSHVPDVINRPDFAPHGAMRSLAPGESLAGALRLDPA